MADNRRVVFLQHATARLVTKPGRVSEDSRQSLQSDRRLRYDDPWQGCHVFRGRESMNARSRFFALFVTLILGTPSFAQLFLPIYSADPARRARQLGYTSENLRAMHDEWERIWFLDQPSGLTPFPNYGGGTPFIPSGARSRRSFVRSSPSAGPRIVIAPRDRRVPLVARRDVGSREKRVLAKEEADAEEMRELFALGERAEANGKTSLARTYFRMVANGPPGVLRDAAQTKLAAFDTNG